MTPGYEPDPAMLGLWWKIPSHAVRLHALFSWLMAPAKAQIWTKEVFKEPRRHILVHSPNTVWCNSRVMISLLLECKDSNVLGSRICKRSSYNWALNNKHRHRQLKAVISSIHLPRLQSLHYCNEQKCTLRWLNQWASQVKGSS